MARATNIFAGMIRLWCVLALVMVGFAHQPVSATPFGPVEQAAYVLPDGTLPVFCINDVVDTKPAKFSLHGCDACRLSASILLPPPPQAGGRIAFSRPAELGVIVAVSLVQRLYPPNARPRAPPVSVIAI
jgi:hypothetical protein